MAKPAARARRRGTRPPGLAVRAVFWVCQKMAGRPFTSVNTNWERARRGRSSTRSMAAPRWRVASRLGALEVERAMRPGAVVVGDVSVKDPFQVPPAQDQQVIQALPPDRAHPSLADGVGQRCRVHLVETLSPDVFESAIPS